MYYTVRYIRRIFQPPPAVSEFRIYVFIRRIYGNIRRNSIYTPYSCRIFLGNSKPQPFWSWLEPVIVKQVTDGVEGLVCKLKCMKGGGCVCGKLLGIVNPSRSAKEHATERGCRGHTYIRYLKLRIYGIWKPDIRIWPTLCITEDVSYLLQNTFHWRRVIPILQKTCEDVSYLLQALACH